MERDLVLAPDGRVSEGVAVGAVTAAAAAAAADKVLLGKIATRQAKVGVLGLGYVGLPLARAVTKAGFPTVGIDVSPEKVAEIEAEIEAGIGTETVAGDAAGEVVGGTAGGVAGKLTVSADPSLLAECDVAIICVPTPLSKNHEPDLSYVEAAAREIARYMLGGAGADGPRAGCAKLVIVESTSYPGTTEEVVRPILEAAGHVVGDGFFLAFSPERVDPANPKYGIENTPKVVGGCTDACRELAVALYEQFVERVVPVSSTQAAEMSKLLENIFRCVNIALVNELAMLCDRMGVDIWEVVDAAATKPFGFMRFYPGPGLGGHCIPIDPFYLSWRAREFDFHTEFIELAGKVNENMPYYVAEKVARALSDHGKALRGAKVLILGVAYKPDVADTRQSPALKVIEILEGRGAEVSYSDPFVPRVEVGGRIHESVGLGWRYVGGSGGAGGGDGVGAEGSMDVANALGSVDCAVVLTAHSGVDYGLVAREAPLVVDTRNVMGRDGGKVCRL